MAVTSPPALEYTSIRPGTRALASPAWTASRGMPSPRHTEMAARALSTLNSPGMVRRYCPESWAAST